MCGRFTLRQSQQEIARALQALNLPLFAPRYNIAPTQTIAVVRAAVDADPAAGDCRTEVAWLHWGLIPSWATDPSIAQRLINARAETIDSKPAFRESFRRRRCLVIADGFFEWQKRGGRKQPHHIQLEDGRVFGMAGIWDHWQHGELAIESCAVITTTANELVSELHDRMPVIIDPADYDCWLDPTCDDSQRLKALLRPWPAAAMRMVPVSSAVSNVQNDSPRCVEPLKLERTLELFPGLEDEKG